MKLTWDDVGTHFFKAGVDHCVLFTKADGVYQSGVAWNGITKVDEKYGGHEKTELFTDDVRSEMLFTPYSYGGNIHVFAYPDEFDPCIGNTYLGDGMILTGQDQIPFAFCYRKLLGNDTQNTEFGYELHFIYDALVTSIEDTASTLGEQAAPIEMGFEFECIGEEFASYGKVAHVIVSSKLVSENKLSALEEVIYGTENSDARLPLPEEIQTILNAPFDQDDT